jgi:hypothetical protein
MLEIEAGRQSMLCHWMIQLLGSQGILADMIASWGVGLLLFHKILLI